MQPNRWAGFIRGLAAIGLLTGVVSLTDQVQAANGNGPYYAEPSWSQKLPAATRFVVLTDWNSEAVLDRETGLVWDKSPTVTNTWANASAVCLNTIIGGRTGWRLPAIPELMSLVDRTQDAPFLPLGHPLLGIQQTAYWSATTNATDPGNAYFVDFSTSGALNFSKLSRFRIWCVRGGMIADAY